MPIHLVTGTPGAGKTLLAIQTALDLAGVSWKGREPDDIASQLVDTTRADYRPLYVCGVEGIREDIFEILEDPLTWQDLPDGSIVLVDEVWRWFDRQDVKTDRRVKDLAVHRHRGFDFVMTTQFPNQIIPHVRALVSPHFHLVRKYGAQLASWYSWPAIETEANSPGKKELAERRNFSYPKEVFPLYKSASQHTIKRRLPRKLKLAALAVLAVPVLGWLAVSSLGAILSPEEVVAAADGAAVATTSDVEVIDSSDWEAMFTPRIDRIPASAPAYDGLTEPVRVPRPVCVAVGDWPRPQTCRCWTQDATDLDMPMAACIEIVAGGVWEPWIEARRRENGSS